MGAHHSVLKVLILAAQPVDRVRHPDTHPPFRANARDAGHELRAPLPEEVLTGTERRQPYMNTCAPLQASLEYNFCLCVATAQLQVCSISHIVYTEVLPNVVLLQPKF